MNSHSIYPNGEVCLLSVLRVRGLILCLSLMVVVYHTFTPLHPHIFTLHTLTSHILTPSHPHTLTSHILTPSHPHPHIFTFTPSYPHILTPYLYTSHPHTITLTSSHLHHHTLISSHPHILTPLYLTSSHHHRTCLMESVLTMSRMFRTPWQCFPNYKLVLMST